MELRGADVLPSSDVRNQGEHHHVSVPDERLPPQDKVLPAYSL